MGKDDRVRVIIHSIIGLALSGLLLAAAVSVMFFR